MFIFIYNILKWRCIGTLSHFRYRLFLKTSFFMRDFPEVYPRKNLKTLIFILIAFKNTKPLKKKISQKMATIFRKSTFQSSKITQTN